MIPKSELAHGLYYGGRCRNATVARWNAETNRFYYWRHKFNETFLEEINHPEDNNGYDVFIPNRIVIPNEIIPFEGEGVMEDKRLTRENAQWLLAILQKQREILVVAANDEIVAEYDRHSREIEEKLRAIE